MEINFVLNPEDLATLARYDFARRLKRKSKLGGLGLIMVLVSSILLWVIHRWELSRGRESNPWAVYLTAIVFVWLLLLTPCLKWWVGRGVMKRIVESDKRKLYCPRRLILTPESLQFASEYANATYNWVGIDNIAVTKAHIFIYVSSAQAQIVPRRAFPDEHQFREFAETAMRYMNSGKEDAQRISSETERAGSAHWREEASKHFQSSADRERLRADDAQYRP
jgi:hypothetical protein